MKRFLTVLVPLSSMSIFGLLSFISWHRDVQKEAPSCGTPEVKNVADKVGQSADGRVYYVGCGGLF